MAIQIGKYKRPGIFIEEFDNSIIQTPTVEGLTNLVIGVSKKGPGGTKFTATGHDGSSEAKSKVVNHKADLLKQSGYYIEVSGKIKDVLVAKGAPIVKDPEVIKKVLAGKEIEKFNEDGSYVRKIGGHSHEKVMLGNPT